MDTPMLFDAAALAAAVRHELAVTGVPTDHKNAFVLVATPLGLKGVLTVQVNDVWTIDSMVSVDRHGAIDGAVSVKATW